MIRSAMLFAAGLGTRLRPLTDRLPKALVPVGGKPIIDYNLVHFLAHGCARVVVNTHYLAPLLQAHLAARPEPALRVLHEPTLLETGGGLVNALPLLGDAPFFSANSDAFWLDGPRSALTRMSEAWDPARMDALLLLAPLARAVGYGGKGDFDLTREGRLRRSPGAPYVFTGLQILQPTLLAGRAAVPFSLREVYAAAQQPDGTLHRMFGLVHDGDWVHVGTPAELETANQYLLSAT